MYVFPGNFTNDSEDLYKIGVEASYRFFFFKDIGDCWRECGFRSFLIKTWVI